MPEQASRVVVLACQGGLLGRLHRVSGKRAGSVLEVEYGEGAPRRRILRMGAAHVAQIGQQRMVLSIPAAEVLAMPDGDPATTR